MKRALIASCGLILLLPVLVIGAAAGVLGGGTGVSLGAPVAFTESVAGIPAEYLRLFQAAGAQYGVPWTVLAGIGKVECDDGQDPSPSCTQPGVVNSAGAGGPMQFLASTWRQYGVSVSGPPDRWNPADAIYAAARYLQANGAPAELQRAIFAYNHSAAYVEDVLRWAALYKQQAQATSGPFTVATAGGAPSRAVAFALAQRGVPYVWGGESPAGYDCSGLVQAAYRAAGITLPRVAQEQYEAGPHLPPGTPLQPGDLVFFGGDPSSVAHVGIAVSASAAGTAEMVDAPYTGTVVQVQSFPMTPGVAWGQERYLGATRPAAAGASSR